MPCPLRRRHILRKLEWYRAGGETSECQWNDVRGIRDVAGTNLKIDYMQRWANDLGVADFLAKLLSDSPTRSRE